MKLQVLFFVTECVIVVQSQLSRHEFNREFFELEDSNETLYVTDDTENETATEKMTTQYVIDDTENVTASKKMTTQTPKQISRSTILSTLLPTTPSSTIESSTPQHKKYSSMSFLDFMNVSGMGEKSLTTLLRKFFLSSFRLLFLDKNSTNLFSVFVGVVLQSFNTLLVIYVSCRIGWLSREMKQKKKKKMKNRTINQDLALPEPPSNLLNVTEMTEMNTTNNSAEDKE